MSHIIVPERKPVRPAGLSRRGFLRALGVTAATVAVGGVPAVAAEPPQLGFYAYETIGGVACDGVSCARILDKVRF